MTFPYIEAVERPSYLVRRLDSPNQTDHIQLEGISEYRLYVLQWVSLVLAGASVISTLFALYWFVRMRRSFRHDLILLLIQADLFKSLWFVLFPVVDFLGADTSDGSAFCETSGFFLATGIEASDIAVLLISLHTAIYVFAPSRVSGHNGLYPYRRLAYGVYVGFPLLMASLAFLKGPTGYRNVGDACYLDAADDWHRMYLSWVPRYIIFGIIFILHVSMYIYIRILLEHFSRRSSSAHSALGRALPPTPPLECHGLIPPSAQDSRRTSTFAGSLRLRMAKSLRLSMAVPSKDRISSSPATICVHVHGCLQPGAPCEVDPAIQGPAPVFDVAPGQPSMHRFRFRQASVLNRQRSEPRLGPYEMSTSSLVAEPPHTHPALSERHDSNASHLPLVSQTSNESFYRRPIVCPGNPPPKPISDPEVDDTTPRPSTSAPPQPLVPQSRHISPSLLNLLTILRRGPSPTLSSRSTTDTLRLSPEAASSGLISSRLHTRRQLRLLFVYPLSYLATWSLPFISHLLGYDDHRRASGDHLFWLLLASLTAVCLQGTVDSILFMLQVRPWRHVRKNVGFWSSLKERLRIRWRWFEERGGGRSTEEMRDGERAARVRREVEAAQEAAERQERERTESGGVEREVVVAAKPIVGDRREKRVSGRRAARNWWDVELDGILEKEEDGGESSDDGEQDEREHEYGKALDIEKG